MKQGFSIFNPQFLASLGNGAGGASLGPEILEKVTSHWTMDQTSGNRLDAVGALDLVPSGTVAYTDGKDGYSALFVTTGALSVASDPSMAPASGQSVTYCFWFLPATTADSFPLSKENPGPTGGGLSLFQVYWSGLTEGNFSLKVHTTDSASVTIDSPLSCAYQQWHFVALTLGAGGNKLSIDGEDFVTVGLPLVNAYANHSATPLVVGGRYNSGPTYETSGKVDGLTLCNQALTIEEVRWLYNSGAGRAFPYA